MRPHRMDAVSLGFGLFFLLCPLLWVALHNVDLRLPDVGWFVAGALILVGVLGAIGALRSGRSRAEDRPPA